LKILGHRFGARKRRSTQKELDSEEIRALNRTISIQKDSMKALESAHERENVANDRASKLEKSVTNAFLEDAELGHISKIPIKYSGKGWAGILATGIKSVPDDKIPGVNADTKEMLKTVVEDNKEVVEQLAPMLVSAIFQNLPEDTKAGFMKFLAPGAKEKGK